MSEYSQVRYWIEELPKRGVNTFSVKEAEDKFPEKPKASVRRALARLSSARKIHSVWNGFYAISVPDYGLSGITDPVDYIDQLMRHLGCDYYIALLTAALYWGAAHQLPMVFQVICNSVLRSKTKNGIRILPVYKKRIPDKYVVSKNSRTAAVKISSPELTAIDLLMYMIKAGGINNIATVLCELAEELDFGRVDADFFNGVPTAAVQRLGYILDVVLEEKDKSDVLYEKARQANLHFSVAPLVVWKTNYIQSPEKNTKWKIIVNEEVDSDI